jgi:hypothetical protein
MAIVHVLSDTWSNGGTSLAATVFSSGTVEQNIDALISGAYTVNATISQSGLVDLFAISTATATMHLGVSGTLMLLNSGVPLTWNSQSPLLSPLISGSIVSGLVFTPVSGAISSQISFRSLENI